MKTPILLFVYNRPVHTEKTIEALSKNYCASESELFIFSDGAKNNNSLDNVNKVREFIDSVENKFNFKSVQIYKSEKNKGLANSVISGVTKIIDIYNSVVVLEDDLITSKDFIVYMNDALDYYENNKSIWSISGYNIPIKIPDYYNHDVYLSYRGCSWGWATWKDRWDKVDWSVSDYSKLIKNRKLRNKFDRGGRDLSNMLDLQMQGKIDSWAIRWCYSQSKLDMYTVYPVKSKIFNIGLDGSGTHSGITSDYDVDLGDGNGSCKFENVDLNLEISKRFQNHYMSKYSYYKYKIKKAIKKILNG